MAHSHEQSEYLLEQMYIRLDVNEHTVNLRSNWLTYMDYHPSTYELYHDPVFVGTQEELEVLNTHLFTLGFNNTVRHVARPRSRPTRLMMHRERFASLDQVIQLTKEGAYYAVGGEIYKLMWPSDDLYRWLDEYLLSHTC